MGRPYLTVECANQPAHSRRAVEKECKDLHREHCRSHIRKYAFPEFEASVRVVCSSIVEEACEDKSFGAIAGDSKNRMID